MEPIFLLGVLMIIILIAIIFQCMEEIRINKEGATFAGPRSYPIIGNAYYFFGNTEDIWNKCMELLDSYPSPFRLRLGNRLFYIAHDAETIKEIYSNPKFIEKEKLFEIGLPWVGTGLFTAPAAKWKVHRKLMIPAFSMPVLEKFVEIFSAKSAIMAKQMEVELDGKEFDIFNYTTRLTLDNVCESAMGIPSNVQTQKEVPYLNALNRMLEISYNRCFKAWLHPDFIFYRTKYGQDEKMHLEYLHNYTDKVIKIKKQVLESKNNNNSDETLLVEERPKKAFLDLLMDINKDGIKFTDKELREEVDTMVAAATDTTATAEIFIFLILASFPEVQQKVYEELYDIYGDADINDLPVKHEDLHQMKYLERVIKETLRIFPVVPFLIKRPTEDVYVGKHKISQKNSIFIAAIKIHRSEKYWDNPMKFDPDRFLPEECAKRTPYTYIPFSAGSRNCIGIKYAMMSIKTLVATILRKYIITKNKIVPLEDIKLTTYINLKPVEPIMLKIERRLNHQSH